MPFILVRFRLRSAPRTTEVRNGQAIEVRATATRAQARGGRAVESHCRGVRDGQGERGIHRSARAAQRHALRSRAWSARGGRSSAARQELRDPASAARSPSDRVDRRAGSAARSLAQATAAGDSTLADYFTSFAMTASRSCFPPRPVYTTLPAVSTTTTYEVAGAE